VLHPAASELADGGEAAFRPFRTLLREIAVPIVEYAPVLLQAAASGEGPYRDGLHLSASGQARLAEALAEAVRLAR
jgi:lysophospholipase L1-like esterase